MKKRMLPTAAQKVLLRALADDIVLCRSFWIGGEAWSLRAPRGTVFTERARTATAAKCAGWIAPVGEPEQINISTKRQYYALTDMGRDALKQVQSA